MSKPCRSRARSGGDDSPNTASTFNNVANYLEQYGQYAEAEKMYRFVLDIRVSQLGESHPHTLVTLNNLAYNVDQQGRTPDAIALYRTVLDRRLTQIGRSHPDLIVSYNNLAVLLARTTETRGEALALAREAVELSRRLKARERSGFAAGGNAGAQALTRALAGDSTGANRDRYAFELMLNTAWARAQDAPSNAKPLTAEAFETAQDLDESAAGRAMALTSARLAAGAGPLAVLVQRQQDLSRRASEIDAEIVRALASISAAEIASRRHQADAINGELAAVDAELRRSFPRYQDMISPSAISKDEVRRRLGRDEGLLLIIPSGYDIYSFALSGRGLLWSRWDGGVAKARSLVDRLRCQADPFTCAAKDQEPAYEGEALPFDRAGAFELYRSLIEPVEAMLRGKAVVFATTSGPLADLPLQLLLTAPQAADSDLASAPWLGERYAFVTLPTVAALRSPRERRPARSSVPFIGFGAPSLSGGASADDQAFSTLVASQDGVTRGVSAALRRLAPLPGTQVELNAMARVLAAPEGSVHLGARATETALRSEPATASARVLAFATHGLLPREIDGLAEPALVLTPPMSVTPDDDGILTASEAAVLPLGADWVILSACNTASSHGGGADSLSALARGFLYAGAGALLASHWRVSDDVTAALTVETLREAKHDPGRSRAAAFMRAERAVRTGRRADGSIIAGWNADWAHPSSWAPFSLISDGD